MWRGRLRQGAGNVTRAGPEPTPVIACGYNLADCACICKPRPVVAVAVDGLLSCREVGCERPLPGPTAVIDRGYNLAD